MSNIEIMRNEKNEEVDLYDTLGDMFKGVTWNREGEDEGIDYPTLEETRREMAENKLRFEAESELNYQQFQKEANFFIVKIRLANGRVYVVDKVPIENQDFLPDEEAELFYHYYKKLNKRHLHIQKPTHRVIRTSIIDELFIEVSAV